MAPMMTPCREKEVSGPESNGCKGPEAETSCAWLEQAQYVCGTHKPGWLKDSKRRWQTGKR